MKKITKHKKLARTFGFLGLAGLATLPIAVVACGSSSSNTAVQPTPAEQLEQELALDKSGGANNTQIQISVRAEDAPKYNAIAALFNTFNKGKVAVTPFDGGKLTDFMQARNASDSLPDLFTSDLLFTQLIQKTKLYARPYSLHDVVSSENASLYNVFPSEKSFVDSDFDETLVKTSQDASGNQLTMPLGYGLSGLFTNMMVLDKDMSTPGVQVDYNIISYVPLADPTTATGDDKEYGSTALLDANHQPVSVHVTTLQGIQDYLSQAGNSSNQPVPDQNWLGWGPGNMYQRIFSLGRSILTQRDQSIFTDGRMAIMPMRESVIPFPIMASLKDGVINSNGYLTQNSFDTNYFPNQKISSDFLNYLWESYGGYLNTSPDGKSPSLAPTGWLGRAPVADSGEVETFRVGRSLFYINSQWVQNWVDSQWNTLNTNLPENQKWNRANFPNSDFAANGDAFKVSSPQIGVLSIPYGTVGLVDSLGMARNLSAASSLVAKRFIKFIWQTQNEAGNPLNVTWGESGGPGNATITKTETVARALTDKFSPANQIILNEVRNDPAQVAVYGDKWYRMGLKNDTDNSDAYNGAGGLTYSFFDGDFYGNFINSFFPYLTRAAGGEGASVGVVVPPRPRWTKAQYEAAINAGVAQYYTSGSVA